MAGHNKWSKVKHKKAATDAVKSRVFSKHAALIAVESRKAGGNRDAPNLAAAIERAKRDAMPKENIERAIAKGSGADSGALVERLFEGYGPGGVPLLISVITDNTNRTTAELRHLFQKAGCQLGEPGSAQWAFTKQGESFHPIAPMTPSEEMQNALNNFLEALNAHADVQGVHAALAE